MGKKSKFSYTVNSADVQLEQEAFKAGEQVNLAIISQ